MRWKAIACIAILAFALAGTAGAQTRYENWARCKDPNPDLAIGACTAIIQSGQETNENLPRAFFNRGIGYDNKGEYDRAIQDYDQAIKLNPNLAQAYSGRGNAYDEKHEYDRAIQDLDQALRLDPNDAYALESRGMAYDGKKEYDRAIQDFDQAIRLEPNNAQAFNSRCWARAILGQLPQALADCNESLRLHPDNAHNAEVLDSRGLVYLKMKLFDAAITDYDAALKLSPKLASSLYGRGIAELAKGDSQKADADIAAAKLIDPKIVSEFEGYGVPAHQILLDAKVVIPSAARNREKMLVRPTEAGILRFAQNDISGRQSKVMHERLPRLNSPAPKIFPNSAQRAFGKGPAPAPFIGRTASCC